MSEPIRPQSDPSAPKYSVELPYPEELQTMLGGAYVVESFLGQGGMGAVYKGLQMPLKRPVAIKILARGVGLDYAFEERFKREAYAMAALTHPHIVRVYDCGDAGANFLFISMEMVEGGDLSDALKNKQVTPELALRLMPQICDGLQAAHERGIIHRDIKPANIFLTKDGRAKVADFGLAKNLDTTGTMVTKTGLGLGTPDYAAPEQYENLSDIDHRADIYSLGVMMYQLLTGTVPRGAWKAPSARCGSDPRLDRVVSKAMENERADRYQSAAEMKADILQVISQMRAAGVTPADQPVNPTASEVPIASRPRTTGNVGARPSAPVPSRPASGAGPAKPQASSVSRPATTTATPTSRAPAKKGPSVNLIAGIACALAVIALAAWMLLKKDGPARGGKVVELLNLEDLKGQALRGTWTHTEAGLKGRLDPRPGVRNDDKNPVYELNYIPPEEYDFEIEFTRTSGNIVQILSAGKSVFAHMWTAGGDDTRPARAGLTRLDGLTLDRPTAEATVMILPPPRDGSHHISVVQVRRRSVRSTLDGKEALNWSGDFSRLSGSPILSMSREGGLGIATTGGEAIFHRATVREISGPGLFVSSGLASAADESGKISAEALKEVVEWTSAQHGFVIVETGGITRKIHAVDDLPGPADHLVECEFSGGKSASLAMPPGVFKILVASTTLQRLAPRSCGLSVTDLAQLVRDKPQLRSLSMDSNKLDDSIVDILVRLPQLESVGLTNNKGITGRGFDKLAVLAKLATISFGDTSLTDENLPAIARITSLKALYLHGTKVTDAGMAALLPLKNLEEIRLKSTAISPRGIKALQAAPKLKHIEMEVANGTADLVELGAMGAGFPNVADLLLDFRGANEKAIPAQLPRLGDLASFPSLRRLELSGPSTISGSNIAGLPTLPKLEHLLMDFGFTDDDAALLKGAKTLRILKLPNARFTEAAALTLTGLVKLNEIGKSAFTPEGLKAFKEYRPEVRVVD